MDACIIAGFAVIVLLAIISLIGAWHSTDSKGIKISCTITIIMTIAAFLCAYIRNPFEFEDGVGILGVVATILSIPVTVLIGWNIYNALDLNKRVKHIEEENMRIINNTESALVDIQIRANDALNKLDRNRIQTEEYCMGIVDFLQGFSIIGENSNYMQAYRIFVSSILHFTRCNNKVRSNIDVSLNNMEVCLNEAKPSDYNNIGNLLDFEFAVDEIIQSPSTEFTTAQREKFVLLENRKKNR